MKLTKNNYKGIIDTLARNAHQSSMINKSDLAQYYFHHSELSTFELEKYAFDKGILINITHENGSLAIKKMTFEKAS